MTREFKKVTIEDYEAELRGPSNLVERAKWLEYRNRLRWEFIKKMEREELRKAQKRREARR